MMSRTAGAPMQDEALIKRYASARRVVNAGLFSNIILAIAKTSAGVLGGSQSLLADGINSTSDVVYYIFVKIFTRDANKPPDEEHPFGHQQMESIAAMIVGAFVITTAIAIFWHSISKVVFIVVQTGTAQPVETFTVWIAAPTVMLKIFLTFYTKGIGQKTCNPAITALAFDHRNDVFSSLAATIGISLDKMGVYWGDPVAGAIVAVVILGTGIEILRQSSAELMDTIPGAILSDHIRSIVFKIKDVKKIEEIKAHRFGPYIVVNITIGVDEDLTVRQGDAIATNVENALCQQLDMVKRVYVHYHPYRM